MVNVEFFIFDKQLLLQLLLGAAMGSRSNYMHLRGYARSPYAAQLEPGRRQDATPLGLLTMFAKRSWG